LPAINASKFLNILASGEILRELPPDSGSVNDFSALPHAINADLVTQKIGGDGLKVMSSDKGCVTFFEFLVRKTGLELLSWHEQEGEFRFFLRKP
jgi:TusA-related sulfurtransferase